VPTTAACKPNRLCNVPRMTAAMRPALQWALTEIPANRPRGNERLMMCPSVEGLGGLSLQPFPAGHHSTHRCTASVTTPAQLRPLAPQTPAPGNVAAPVRNNPGTAVS